MLDLLDYTEADLHTDGFMDLIKKAGDKARETYEKSGMSWKTTTQQKWDTFVKLVEERRSQPNMPEKKKKLNMYETYEVLDYLDISIRH